MGVGTTRSVAHLAPAGAAGLDEGGPEPAAEVAALLDQARERLAVLDVEVLSGEGRSQLMAAVDRAEGSLTAVKGRLLTAVAESGQWQTGADRNATAWRGRTAGIGFKAARTEMAQAQTIQALPTVARGVEDGTVSPAHLLALARVTPGTVGAAREALASSDAQAELVAMAQRLDADAYGRAVARKVAAAEPSRLDRDHAAQRAARSLALTDTATGTRIAGQVDRMAGHRLRLALEALSPRPAADDERTHEQRWADALDTMAENVLSSPATTPGAAVRPHVSFVMTEQAWVDLKQHAAARTAGSSLALEDQAREPVTLEDGTPVPTTEIGRALCDCEITRVVLDAQSQPVDAGRTKRLYDGPLRRAIITRDRTCSWPGCARHARWCEIHHIRWWDRDGSETSIDNGVLLCRDHHRRVHEFDLTVSRHALPPRQTGSNGIATVRYTFRRPDGRHHVPPFGNDRHPPPAETVDHHRSTRMGSGPTRPDTDAARVDANAPPMSADPARGDVGAAQPRSGAERAGVFVGDMELLC